MYVIERQVAAEAKRLFRRSFDENTFFVKADPCPAAVYVDEIEPIAGGVTQMVST